MPPRTCFALFLTSMLLAACGDNSSSSSTGTSPASSSASAGPTATSPSTIRSTPVADLASLPDLPDDQPIRAASVFEPAGAVFPQGVEVTWTLPESLPWGRCLWIQTLDEKTGEWHPTGERAMVLEGGREARGKVFHFSTIGLTDEAGCWTEWVWLIASYREAVDRLAANLTEKYRRVLDLPAGFSLRAKDWRDGSKNAHFERVGENAGGGREDFDFDVKNTHCLEAGREEFRKTVEELDLSVAESMANWLEIASGQTPEAVVLFWRAHLDLLRVAREWSPIAEDMGLWANDCLEKFAYKKTRDAMVEFGADYVRLAKVVKNPLVKVGVNAMVDPMAKARFLGNLRDIFERPGKEKLEGLAAELVQMADLVVMDLAFNRNSGKVGTFLSPPDAVRWELSAESLAALKATKEFSPEVEAKAAKLGGKNFASLEAFRSALDGSLTPEERDAFSPALENLARTLDDRTMKDILFQLGGPITAGFNRDEKITGLRQSYHLAQALAIWESELLAQKIAGWKWELKGDVKEIDAGWLDAFENQAERTHEFRSRAEDGPRAVMGRTGPPGPGDGNFPELRREFRRYTATMRSELRRGEAVFQRAVTGPDKMLALGVLRLFSSDVQKYLAEDLSHKVKAGALKAFGKTISNSSPMKKIFGKLGTVLFEDTATQLLAAGVEKLLPDQIEALARSIDLATVRVVNDLGIEPQVTLAYAAGSSGLIDLVTPLSTLPDACAKKDPGDLRFKVAWSEKPTGPSGFVTLSLLDPPTDYELRRKLVDSYTKTFSGKWVRVTSTCAGRTETSYQQCLDTGVGSEMLSRFHASVDTSKAGSHTLTISFSLGGETFKAEAPIEIRNDDEELDRNSLEVGKAKLKRALEIIEEDRQVVQKEIGEVEEQIAHYEEQLADKDLASDDKERITRRIKECQDRIASDREILKFLEPQPGGRDRFELHKADVAAAHKEIALYQRKLEQYADARKSLAEALRWGERPEWVSHDLSKIAMAMGEFELYRTEITKAGIDVDLEMMSRLALSMKGDLATARAYLQELARLKGVDPSVVDQALPREDQITR